ncbi:MAG: hypothetical protein OEU55_06315 [Desulfobacterales bacterium]|nr:hypothetical protein [Desulfobacterales bacterium]MDH4010314.1 hypothetical protein [Desulfobacterales bacterium]
MKSKNEIMLAWKIWHLISRLNDLIWDYYEDEFIHQHLKETDQQYRGTLIDYMSLDDPDIE